MLNRFLSNERGQAYVEWMVFFPCLLAMMFSLIFFSRLGVLSERSQSAVRYGDMVSFRNGQPYTVATVEAVIDELLHTNSNELGPLCLEPTSSSSSTQPVNPTATPIAIPTLATNSILALATAIPATTPAPQNTSIANRVASDTQAALVQAQDVPGVTPVAPSAQPYWRPDTVATSGCNPASIALQSGSYGVGNLPISVQTVSISSSLNIPSYIAPYVMNGETSAKMGFLNVATPNVLLACVPGLQVALAILQPSLAGKSGPKCPSTPTGS